MNAHPYIDRLAQFRKTTLTVANVAEVLGKHERYARKLLMRGEIAHLKESVGVNSPDDHKGVKWRREVTVGAVLIYLLKITEGDKTDLLEAIKARLPEHHAMCVQQAALSGPLPAGVLDARQHFTPGSKASPASAGRKPRPALRPLGRGDEYQADLFDPHAHLTAHPSIITA